ncbi:TIGR01244 family sulfur transferase [Noviherbaspirillum sp. UKPF54]|uniref:TIGR01244 family sulfur transferase n=1 Tax=Noviherbaspirillum sp. UKPF54 TaxID=2601898 RepID=UPI0011B13D67|nr:TIGR01244 family sulfur transferase [Noviherbaspirillum sp. UKPF54]QDZ28958.1 TIGR01244 family phosphatase [Noviherbaspirillum sp. UKPF54]
MPIHIIKLTDEVGVSEQLQPGDLAEVARMGIRSIINNRPDGEGGDSQPGDAALCMAADAAGLFYAYLPVPSEGFDERAVSRMRALVGELPKPLLAFCRTGARSAQLYHAASGKHVE